MLVDWFTVAAQALNFLVLAWLLKRFLYRPVLDAIDAREAAVARQLAEAEATAAQARSQRAEYEQKLAGLQHDAAARIAGRLRIGDILADGGKGALIGAQRRGADAEKIAHRVTSFGFCAPLPPAPVWAADCCGCTLRCRSNWARGMNCA